MVSNEKMIFTSTTQTKTDGRRSKRMICLLPQGTDIFQWSIQGPSLYLVGTMASTESMIFMNTILTTTHGRRSFATAIMKLLQLQGILTQQQSMKSLCSFSEVTMGIIKMISTDLTSFQTIGILSRKVEEKFQLQDTEPFAVWLETTCFSLGGMMEPNS